MPRAGKIAASILSADFASLGEQVKLVSGHADLIHIDAMDAHFVPPLTVGPVVVESLRRVTDLPLHCHLQVSAPDELLASFAEAGADIVSFHVEAVPEPGPVIRRAGSLGMLAGLAVGPDTPLGAVLPHLESLDRVLVMSVFPGWGGQPFLERALPKIEEARGEIDRRGLDVEIEVDGGIDERTASRCVAAGATVLAAGTSIFRAPDPAAAARRLAEAAGRAG
jgi:ribulose-phosphate 3-epimerase